MSVEADAVIGVLMELYEVPLRVLPEGADSMLDPESFRRGVIAAAHYIQDALMDARPDPGGRPDGVRQAGKGAAVREVDVLFERHLGDGNRRRGKVGAAE